VFGLASIAGEWGNPTATNGVVNRLVLSKITLLVRKFLPIYKRTAYGAPSHVGVSPGTKLRTRLKRITTIKVRMSPQGSNTGQQTAFERSVRPCYCFGIVLLF